MRNGGRISAAIDVLQSVLERYQPTKAALRDWGKRARYAGAQDRAFVSGLVLDTLRVKGRIAHHMQSETPRALVLGTLCLHWGWSLKSLEEGLSLPHAPEKLTSAERSNLLLAPDPAAPVWAQGSFPEWLEPYMIRAFGEMAAVETAAMNTRAPVDIRVNTLKVTADAVEDAMRRVGGIPSPILTDGFLIPAPETYKREAAISAIPAYSKGWVEVQDTGSQISAILAQAKPGERVLDYCAGGGGKALALAAHMEGQGEVLAYDIDGRRLSALIPRQARAGADNITLCHPQETDTPLEGFKGEMDCVFVDAPCSGSGTWRRKPDTKWRLKPSALETRLKQQADILQEAYAYVKVGGRMVYVTCSVLREEGEDQISQFLATTKGFSLSPLTAAHFQSPHFTAQAAAQLAPRITPEGYLRLTPHTSNTDGFFVAVLTRDS